MDERDKLPRAGETSVKTTWAESVISTRERRGSQGGFQKEGWTRVGHQQTSQSSKGAAFSVQLSRSGRGHTSLVGAKVMLPS